MRQAHPDAYLQYSNASDQNLATAINSTLLVALATDQASQPLSIFDKPSNSQFRALRACTVRISYGVNCDSTANDDGFETHVYLNNASVIEQSRSGGSARSALTEPGGDSARSFLVDLNLNDFVELRVQKLEATTTLTVRSFGTFMLMELIKLR